MQQIINNFTKMYRKEDLFIEATPTQINRLRSLFGSGVSVITDFYSRYQPNDVPMTKSYVRLLGIDTIIEENTRGEPGKYLAEYGVYVFAVTVGGNVICVDTNDIVNGDASVLIADENFCSYNTHHKCVEIGIVPREVLAQHPQTELIELNYPNIIKCLTKIESSFMEFMLKLSSNAYEDIEKYLE